jgi:hypothetical protein
MRRFGGYRLGCAGCASGSWSDLSRVIGRDNFWSVCLGSFRDRLWYSIVYCYRFCHMLCSADAEDHSGSVEFVFGNHLVSQLVHFSLFAIECVWLDQLSHFEHQKVGNNTYEVLIHMLSVGLGASIFTFVKMCVERYGS